MPAEDAILQGKVKPVLPQDKSYHLTSVLLGPILTRTRDRVLRSVPLEISKLRGFPETKGIL